MKKVSQQTIETIRQRCDIGDVIQFYVPLKRAGASLKACCPFHKEKTPSFHVNTARQIYHCFGCGAGGDVFRFVMEYEKADFMTAVRLLAQRAGVTIEIDEDERRETSNKDRLLRVHEAAASLFQKLLAEDPSADEARAYLKRRQLDGEAARRFRIGWSPDRFDAILEWGRANGFEAELLESSGLAVRNEKGIYDRFRKRVMFPICDEQGRVIGFSGRVLREEDSPAKYVNSPETPLFRKSRVLYAIDKARRAIIEKGQAILCEGQIDTLRCHLAGIENAVAAQGTAVTEEHARILKRYGDEVVVMLDADKAGQDAAIRSAQILMAAGLSVRLATLPTGEDPDSMILKEGVAALEGVLSGASSVVMFLLDLARKRGEMASEAGRMRTVQSIIGVISSANTEAVRTQMLNEASSFLGMEIAKLNQDVAGARVMARAASSDPDQEVRRPITEGRRVEEVALAEAVLKYPKCRSLVREYLPVGFITDDTLRRIVEIALARDSSDETSLAEGASDDAEFSRVVTYLEERARRVIPGDGSADSSVRDCIVRIWKTTFERRRSDVIARATTATGAEAQELAAQRHELTVQIHALQRSWDAALPILELGA